VKWLLIPVLVYFVYTSCKHQINGGIDTGSKTYLEIANQKQLYRSSMEKYHQKLNSQLHMEFCDLRYIFYSKKEVIFENGVIAHIGKLCRYGKCVKIEENCVTFENKEGTYYIFRNELLLPNQKQETKENESNSNSEVDRRNDNKQVSGQDIFPKSN
jgi:hypothetical protein